MDIYDLNRSQDIIQNKLAMKYFSEIIPTVLKYKSFALNDCDLFTKSEDVKEITKEERDKIVSELKDEFIRRFGGY